MSRRNVVSVLGLLATSLVVAACGSEKVSVPKDNAQVHAGAELFAARCAGCHTLDVAGTQGSATKVRDRERTDGPNFNTRRETQDQVLYAIRNGGFSGAIMPENIVVGQDAVNVAAFLSKYAGMQAKAPKGPGN
jgi:mono/diheme cytochrome c family protein